jgi:hypothetical protein
MAAQNLFDLRYLGDAPFPLTPVAALVRYLILCHVYG